MLIATPYNRLTWKDAGKPLCSRCQYNFSLERKRIDEMLSAYGWMEKGR